MSKFLIRDVHLFDGIDVHAQPQTVQVSDGIIQYVGETTPAILPDDNDDDDLVTIDGKGCTLLPGLIDAHTHVFRGVEQVKGAIVAGVTTVLDMHNEPSNARYMKDLARRCSELPEIFSALHAATIDGGWPRAIVRHTNSDPEVLVGLDGWPKLTTPKSAAAYVAQNKAMGADFIKLMQESGECLTLSPLPAPTQTLQEAVVNAAHAHDLLTFAHATNLRETMLVLEAGVDAMAHQFFDQPHTQQLINAYTTSPVRPFVIPTLTAISSMMGLSTARDWVEGPGAAASNKKLLTESSRHCLCDCMKISRPGCNVQFAYDCIKALKSNGVDIVWYVHPSFSSLAVNG